MYYYVATYTYFSHPKKSSIFWNESMDCIRIDLSAKFIK